MLKWKEKHFARTVTGYTRDTTENWASVVSHSSADKAKQMGPLALSEQLVLPTFREPNEDKLRVADKRSVDDSTQYLLADQTKV